VADPAYNTIQDARVAIERLSEADLLRLQIHARFLIFGLGQKAEGEGWQDLIQEAVLRTIEGTRRWPSHIEFRHFLMGTMRSIANSWLKRRAHVSLSLVPAQEAAFAKQIAIGSELDAIRTQLGSDQDAILVFNCLSRDMTGPEIMAQLGLSEHDYRAAVRRIRRRVRGTLN
jgi:DNA-directed RNA polymerase specialized sigma24 family protein